ncbi:MAG: HEPN domain-containing protein [bacterium]
MLHIKQCSALGTLKDGEMWRHLAIIKHFIRGYWFEPNHPKTGPGLLEDKRLALRQLYSYRIKSDYDALEIDENKLEELLKVVEQVINIIDKKGGR